MPQPLTLGLLAAQDVGAGTAVNPYYEIWDPDSMARTKVLPVNAQYLGRVKQNYYPFNYVMPTGEGVRCWQHVWRWFQRSTCMLRSSAVLGP